ncbi:MAG TPA: hypothetical protein VKP11_00740 [Frankiaceae bacterium]|nr:hypothetical protein [Frankiaceae bacterium]
MHVTHSLRKLTARDRVHAATLAVHLGLTNPDPPPAGE